MGWKHAFRSLALGLGLALCLQAAPAQATVVVDLTRQQLVERSDLVVRATVMQQASGWSDDHSRILTRTQLRVDDWLKGQGPSELVVQQLGGVVDGIESHVSGDGNLVVGQEYVLFLRQGQGLVYLTALSLGVYSVQAPRANGLPMVQRELNGLTMATWVNDQMVLHGPPPPNAETLAHLAADVRRLAAGGAR